MIKKNFYNMLAYDDLFVIESFGSWDQAIAKECLEDILNLITEHYFDKPYAIFLNDTEWELNTPDARNFWKETFANKDLHFPTHVAYIVGDSNLKQWVAEKMFEDAVPFEAAVFREIHEGIAWLEPHGYQIPHNLYKTL